MVRGRPHLRADADRRPARALGSGRGVPIEVGSTCDPAACAIGRVAEARLLILDGDVQQGLALLDEAGVATISGDLDPLSTGVVYCELVCALQGLAQYDVAEEWTEAMERWCETNAIGSLHGRCRVHRAEILRLRGSCNEAESQALDGLRGAAPLPATRARVAAERARTDPASQGRHRRRRGSPPGRSSRRVGSPTGSRAGAPGPRRRGHGGGFDPRRPRAPLAGAVQGATPEHRPAARAAARGAGRDRDRGRRHRPGPIGRRRARAHRRPVREQGAASPAPPSPEEGCGSPTAMRRAQSSPCPKRCGSGTKSARPTRRRSPAWASPRPTSASGSEQRADLERQAARTILDRIEAAPSVPPAADATHRDALRRAAG